MWTDGLTKPEILRLANMLINSTNRCLDVVKGSLDVSQGLYGAPDHRDIARDNRALLSNLEWAYENAPTA